MGQQKQTERPQEEKPRPQKDVGPKIDLDIDIGSVDELLIEMDIIKHPERYTVEQRECACYSPPKRDGFR